MCVALRRQQPGPQMIGKPTTDTVTGGADPFAGGNKIKPKFKGAGKLSKAAIGAPTEFRHLSHVGFDPSTGAFDVSHDSCSKFYQFLGLLLVYMNKHTYEENISISEFLFQTLMYMY